MTPEEAIKEYGEALYESGHQRWFHLSKKATQLGIEALERLETVRGVLDTNLVKSLLPSETEE